MCIAMTILALLVEPMITVAPPATMTCRVGLLPDNDAKIPKGTTPTDVLIERPAQLEPVEETQTGTADLALPPALVVSTDKPIR